MWSLSVVMSFREMTISKSMKQILQKLTSYFSTLTSATHYLSHVAMTKVTSTVSSHNLSSTFSFLTLSLVFQFLLPIFYFLQSFNTLETKTLGLTTSL